MKKFILLIFYLEMCSGLILLGENREWQKIDGVFNEVRFIELEPIFIATNESDLALNPQFEYFPKGMYQLVSKAIKKEAISYEIAHVKMVLKSDYMLKNNIYVYLIHNVGHSDHNKDFVLAVDFKRKKFQRIGRWEVEFKKETNGYYNEDLRFIEKSLLEKKDVAYNEIVNILVSYLVMRSQGSMDHVIYSENKNKISINEHLCKGIVDYNNLLNKGDIPKYKKGEQGDIFIKFSLYRNNNAGDLVIYNYEFKINKRNKVYGYPIKMIVFPNSGTL